MWKLCFLWVGPEVMSLHFNKVGFFYLFVRTSDENNKEKFARYVLNSNALFVVSIFKSRSTLNVYAPVVKYIVKLFSYLSVHMHGIYI